VTAWFGFLWGAAFLGFLGVGFIVSSAVTGVEMADLAREVEANKQSISGVEEAIAELAFISGRFGSLGGMYESLKLFWGGLWDDAYAIEEIHLPLMALDIAEMLRLSESYEAALQSTDSILASSQLYLDMLNRQGIVLPTGPMRRGGAAATVEEEIEAARVCLEGGDMDGYEAKMRAAVELDRKTREQQGRTIALTGGVILDVSTLRAGAGIFNISNSNSPRDASDVGTAREIRDEVGKAGRAVCGLLDMTIEMCAASEVALQDWRAAGGGRGGAKAPKTLNLDGALSACRAARGHAAAANNAFVRANHLATNYHDRLAQDVSRHENLMATTRALADERARTVVASAPKYVFLFPATLTAWILKRRADIARRLQSEIAGLRSAVARLRDEMQSSSTFLDHELYVGRLLICLLGLFPCWMPLLSGRLLIVGCQ